MTLLADPMQIEDAVWYAIYRADMTKEEKAQLRADYKFWGRVFREKEAPVPPAEVVHSGDLRPYMDFLFQAEIAQLLGVKLPGDVASAVASLRSTMDGWADDFRQERNEREYALTPEETGNDQS